jgi:adenylosuccinate synthase
MIRIVLGCLFGDEGKGQTVHSLANEDTLVIRFSGGHQVGHTVVTEDNNEHIFSQFGAGTFKGASTLISEYCTVYPKGLLTEYNILNGKVDGETLLQKYFVNPLTMITTPYDVAYNKVIDGIHNHGTTGAGFGATIERNKKHFTLYASDLLIPFITYNKINEISKYYNDKIISLQNMDAMISYHNLIQEEHEGFTEAIDWFRKNIQVKTPTNNYQQIIFEGSQGIMLDQKIGLFPHVTRSNTTALNALEYIKNSLQYHELEIYYVTRAYMTKHGNGAFPESEIELLSDYTISNPENDWQGKMKAAPMDFYMLNHVIRCNNSIVNRYKSNYKTHLIVTCCDQIKEIIQYEEFMKMPVDNIEYKKCRKWN